MSVTRATRGSDLAQQGNEADVSPDNGDKHIKAMGYILVQKYDPVFAKKKKL